MSSLDARARSGTRPESRMTKRSTSSQADQLKGRSSMTEVRNIVLVHGGFVDGSGWKNVYDQLTFGQRWHR